MVKPIFIGMGGSSGSGKTTVARKLLEELPKISKKIGKELKGVVISMDDYYKDLSHLPLSERKKVNLDDPRQIDFNLLNRQMNQLLKRRAIKKPIHSFEKFTQLKRRELVGPVDVIILEGIFALYNKKLLSKMDYKVFVMTDPRISILRRIYRDTIERGRDLKDSIEYTLNVVIPMHDKYVFPTRKNADFLIIWEGNATRAISGLKALIIDYFE
ncbi:MAG: uridine kinase [Nanoarchaeota archaeon]|nr:uridine kinase [Nanoarchaeota archaeon]